MRTKSENSVGPKRNLACDTVITAVVSQQISIDYDNL